MDCSNLHSISALRWIKSHNSTLRNVGIQYTYTCIMDETPAFVAHVFKSIYTQISTKIIYFFCLGMFWMMTALFWVLV